MRALLIVVLLLPGCMTTGDLEGFESGIVAKVAHALQADEAISWDGVKELIADSADEVKGQVIARTETQLEGLSQSGGVLGMAALAALHFFRNHTRKKEITVAS